MRFLRLIAALILFAATASAHAQLPPERLSKLEERHSFAPMWTVVPRFTEPGGAVPAACYCEIWHPLWQQELKISAEQKKSFESLRDKFLAEAKQHSEQFQKLSDEEKKTEVESWGGKPSPWLRKMVAELRRQLEAVLTPEQIQAIKDYEFPIQAIGALYDRETREKIGFDAQQQDAFRHLAGERANLGQEESLRQADEIWALMTAEQKKKLVDVVKHQGPTSAILALASELNWNFDAAVLSYPMLSEPAVRKRLGLAPEKEKELEKVLADAMAEARQDRANGTPSNANRPDKQQIEAILTADQMKTLEAIDLRRKVVLAIGYPEKQKSIDFTDQQRADLARIQRESHDRLYPIDRELLANAVKLLTPPQRAQLQSQFDQEDQPSN